MSIPSNHPNDSRFQMALMAMVSGSSGHGDLSRNPQVPSFGGVPAYGQLHGPQWAYPALPAGPSANSGSSGSKGSAKSRQAKITQKSPAKKTKQAEPYRRAPVVKIEMYQPTKVEMKFGSSWMEDPQGAKKQKVAKPTKPKSTATMLQASALEMTGLKCHRCSSVIPGPNAKDNMDKHLVVCSKIKCVLCGNLYKNIKTLQNHQMKAHMLTPS